MKRVTWTNDVKDTRQRRPCACVGCKHCVVDMNAVKRACCVFGTQRCADCKEYRCEECILVFSKQCKLCREEEEFLQPF